MGIIAGGDAFFAEFEASRICCITGSLGSGKSLFSHILAERYLKQGYKMVTNMSSVWADDLYSIKPDAKGQYKLVVILDEGGLYVRTAKTVQKISSFARKLDTYIIFAGKKLPHVDLQEVTIGEWFNFQKHFLIPLKVYKWDVEKALGKRYSGYVWVSGWKNYYGIYSTLDPGDFPATIVKAFEIWTEEFFAKFGREYKIQDVVMGETTSEQETTSEFGDAVKSMGETLSVSKRKTRGRW